jgi:hypothetical protein
LIAALAAVPLSAAIERQNSTALATTIEMVEGYGPPDATVTIPVDLRAAPGVAVGTVDFAITLPPSLVTFERAVLSSASENAGVTLSVTSRATDDGSLVLRCVLTAANGEARSQTIPDGQIVHLIVHITTTAPPETAIPLEPQVTVLSADSPPVPVQPVSAPASRILVMAPVATSCFFYMH